ncbi:MAG: NAD(P)H-dependent oxidoreductase [Chloroflexi bacterium]|nr:NAD(P)H-dependent oxidoreductase [Chloroflexota bacterium]
MEYTSRGAKKIRLLGISGSLRRGSYNTALLRAAEALSPQDVGLEMFDLSDLPLYNGDLEAGGDPVSVSDLKRAIREADGIVFASPEYNHSFSGVMKNAIDWASRDRGPGSLAGKPVTIVGAGGMSGTARAQMHLENVLSETGSLVMTKPGVLIANPWDRFDADGRLEDEGTREVIADHIRKFRDWVLDIGSRSQSLAA